MKELILCLVASCERRILMVEQLITGACYATASLEESLAEVVEKRAGLENSLQEVLARNCSLRRKDFNALMERITSDSEGRKDELEQERRRIRDELREYLGAQKHLVASLRQQLADFTCTGDKDTLEATTAMMKAAYQKKGRQVSALLRQFQLRLEVFQREQEEINNRLERLVERGEALRFEDLRQLEASGVGQERKVERELRRQEVERLLAHFKGQRQGVSRYRR